MLAQSSSSLGDLIQKAQAGSEEAAQLLYGRCRPHLLVVIRQHLSPPLRNLYDSDDFLQDTFKEVFTRHFAGEVLRSPDVLWPYLKRIAENKVRDANRKHVLSKCHNIMQTVSLEDLDNEAELLAQDLSPADALMLKDLVEDRLIDLLEQLPSMLRGIIELLLKGCNTNEIAQQLCVDHKRVYRAMDWLKRKVLE